jgi:plasmid stabilization system protein ParE
VRRIVWSAAALDRFDGIVDYIARDDPLAAARVADRIDQLIGTLADCRSDAEDALSEPTKWSSLACPISWSTPSARRRRATRR